MPGPSSADFVLTPVSGVVRMKNLRRLSSLFSSRSLWAVALAAAVLAPGAMALGDAFYFLSGKAKTPFKVEEVTISGIRKEGGTEYLDYTTNSTGRANSKVLSTVVQIEVEGETLFNQAEAQSAKGDFKNASENYRKALKKAGAKEWLKQRADGQLLALSDKTGDFLGAVAGFVEMARKDPVAASKHVPSIPKDVKKDQLAQAITIINTGVAGTKAPTKLTIYPLLADLYTANGDQAKASQIIAEAGQLQKTTPAAGTADMGDDSKNALKKAEATSTLTQAKAAFDGHQYDQVVTLITSHSASFADPDNQANALFLIAEARAGQATAANTQAAWEDAALAYMRVVAHFKSLTGSRAAEALYKTGTIEEKLKKIPEAITIYTQVVNEFKDSAVAKDAQAALARIKG